MKTPRYATITLSLDTEKYRLIRPEAREAFEKYHIDRLLCGEETAEREWEHMGIKVTIRDAVKPEIL